MSFSGITFVLFCFIYVFLLSSKPRSIVLRYVFFVFSEHLYNCCFLLLSGEYTLYAFLPDGVFLPCDHGLDFDISLCESSNNQSKFALRSTRINSVVS